MLTKISQTKRLHAVHRYIDIVFCFTRMLSRLPVRMRGFDADKSDSFSRRFSGSVKVPAQNSPEERRCRACIVLLSLYYAHTLVSIDFTVLHPRIYICFICTIATKHKQ
jgi:hypothetical protein